MIYRPSTRVDPPVEHDRHLATRRRYDGDMITHSTLPNDPDEIGISDSELTELAFNGGSEWSLSDDAMPLLLEMGHFPSMLGSWYMPPTSTRGLSGWRRPVVLAIVTTLVVLEALGLCSVFGQVVVG
jgi:hypothetical protein